MRPVSARFLANLGLARWAVMVEWSADAGVTWHECTYIDGDPTADATSQVRWGIPLTLTDVPTGLGGLTPFGGRVRVKTGMVYDVDDVEWVRLGTYRAESVDPVFGTDNITVAGKSLEQAVIDDRFLTPRTFRPQPGITMAERLIVQSVPDALVHSRISLDEGAAIPTLVSERDRWAIIDGARDAKSVARSLGARVYCDGAGLFIIAPVPTLGDTPVWTTDTGPDGVLVGADESRSREGVYNVVVARGSSDATDAKGKPVPPVGPAIAADTDPTSPTYIKGPFGRVPRFYSSPLLTRQYACERAALSMLAPALGLRQTLDLTTVANPALEVGDTIAVRMSDGTIQSNLIDKIGYSLTGGPMTLSCRATTTRLTGSLFLSDGDAEGDDENSGVGDDGD